ncbi:MAG: hypothetical protein K2Y37_26600 [Pirellulales bacterium]|nr:hypothetical protein [Pirellulales bacterium]
MKRLKHAGRVFAAGAENPAIPARLGYTPTATVEEAIRQAEAIHGPECSLVCVEIPTRL